MRIVLDSNVVLSGILWGGIPRQLIDAGIEQRTTLLTSTVQLAELDRVAPRKRFAEKMALHQLTPRLLTQRYSQIAVLVVPADIGNVVLTDPDLLNLKHYQRIPIITPAEAATRIPAN